VGTRRRIVDPERVILKEEIGLVSMGKKGSGNWFMVDQGEDRVPLSPRMDERDRD
jgi:hypothetical protein